MSRFVTDNFVPVRVHVRDDAAEFQRLGARYAATWTPTILTLDGDGTERHRVEGFLPAGEFLVQLKLGLGHLSFRAGLWERAERHFGELAQDASAGDAAAEGTYWAGVSRYKQSNDASALGATARALAERHPESSWRRKASVWA